MLDMVSSLIIIAAVAIATFATRAASFVVFPKGKEVPPTVKYIGTVLPPAVIGMLVVYCLRSTQLFAYPYGIPELIACLAVIGACLAVIGLHAWRRNVLLSVGAGTVLYMVLVQMIFV